MFENGVQRHTTLRGGAQAARPGVVQEPRIHQAHPAGVRDRIGSAEHHRGDDPGRRRRKQLAVLRRADEDDVLSVVLGAEGRRQALLGVLPERAQWVSEQVRGGTGRPVERIL